VNIAIRKEGSAVIVCLSGRVDTLTANTVQQELECVLAEHNEQVVVDCSELEYLSSAGLRVILTLAKQAGCRPGGFACCALQPVVKRVFDVSGFTRMIPVYECVDEALKIKQ
jgi:anti-anti-sigma factor